MLTVETVQIADYGLKVVRNSLETDSIFSNYRAPLIQFDNLIYDHINAGYKHTSKYNVILLDCRIN